MKTKILAVLILMLLSVASLRAAELKQNTATVNPIFMVDSADHFTGKTGLTVKCAVSKNGGAFSTITSLWTTELGYGWYAKGWDSSVTDTVGPLAAHCWASNADNTDFTHSVVAATSSDNATSINQWGSTVNASAIAAKKNPWRRIQ